MSDFTRFGITELIAMNILSDHGVISDNCVKWIDVGNKEAALEFLEQLFSSQPPRDPSSNEAG
jgi:hypothetical protein